MYCINCGKNNPDGSKFCQHCGIKLSSQNNDLSIGKNTFEKSSTPSDYIDKSIHPYPYVISLWKFFFLSILTFGIFHIYWFYRQWKSFYAVRNQKHGWFYISFESFFGGITSFSLFKIIDKEVRGIDARHGLSATPLAILFFSLNILYKLPDPYWLLSSLSILALLPIQNSVNYYWGKKYGDKLVKSNFGAWNIIVAIIGFIVVTLALMGTFGKNSTDPSTTQSNSTDIVATPSPAINAFKSAYRATFIKSCEGGASGSEELCKCVANKLITAFTDDELTEISKKYVNTNKTPEELSNAVVECTVPTETSR